MLLGVIASIKLGQRQRLEILWLWCPPYFVREGLWAQNLGLLEQNCSSNLGFDDNKVRKEQLDMLTYVQVCEIISLKFNLQLTLMKAFAEKLKVSDSEGLEFDESGRGVSASEGSKSDCGVSGDSSDAKYLS